MKKFKPPTPEEIQAVFSSWNRYKGQGNWKSHRELTYETETAIKDVLKHYTVEQICKAIDNYALVLLSKNCIWSYAWTLYQFLIRSRPDNRQEKQFWRFLENNFIIDDYMTIEAIKARVAKRQESYKKIEPPVVPPTTEEKAELRKQFDELMHRKKPEILSPEEIKRRKEEQIGKLEGIK